MAFFFLGRNVDFTLTFHCLPSLLQNNANDVPSCPRSRRDVSAVLDNWGHGQRIRIGNQASPDIAGSFGLDFCSFIQLSVVSRWISTKALDRFYLVSHEKPQCSSRNDLYNDGQRCVSCSRASSTLWNKAYPGRKGIRCTVHRPRFGHGCGWYLFDDLASAWWSESNCSMQRRLLILMFVQGLLINKLLLL